MLEIESESARVHAIGTGDPAPGSGCAKSDKHRDPYALWVGRSAPTKHLPALLAAFSTIERQMDVHLVMAGEESQVDPSAPGADHGSLGRVTPVGPVSAAETFAPLDRAWVLVSPAQYEGFGLAPLEAMAGGRVVTAHTRARPEVCGDAAVDADPRQPPLTADASHLAVCDCGAGLDLEGRSAPTRRPDGRIEADALP